MGFCCSCTTRIKPEEYMDYMRKHSEKFSRTFKRHGVSATISYRPNELYAAQHMIADDSMTVDSAMKPFENSLLFTLAISADSIGNKSLLLERDGKAGFSTNVFKHTFGHKEDIFLLYKQDTVKCFDYRFERSFGMSNEETFVIGFNKNEIKNNLHKYHLIIRNIAVELGTIDCAIKQVIHKAPQLKG